MLSMDKLLSSSGVDSGTEGVRISVADVEAWAGSHFIIQRLSTVALRDRAGTVLGDCVNQDKPVFGAALVALLSSIGKMMEKGQVPCATIRGTYEDLKRELKVGKKVGLQWSSYSTWMVNVTGFSPPDDVEKPHLGALNKASDHYAIDTSAGRGTSWNTDISKGFEHATGLFCIDRSEDPSEDLEKARHGIYQKFNANTAAESTLVREQRMRVAERVKAAKIQGLKRQMTPEVTALIKHVETNMASELANHATYLKKTEKHPFFLRLNDHREGVPVRTQGIKNITCSKIDMTAGMVDAWMDALLNNERFADDFDDMFKPFPGEVSCAEWLRETVKSLRECRVATGPVPAKDVMRAGTFELLATLMSNAVLTPSLSEKQGFEATDIEELGTSEKEVAGEITNRLGGRIRKRTATSMDCPGTTGTTTPTPKRTSRRRSTQPNKVGQISERVEVSGWTTDPEFERLLGCLRQAKGVNKGAAALEALHLAVASQDVAAHVSRVLVYLREDEGTVPEGHEGEGGDGEETTVVPVARPSLASTNGGTGSQGDGRSALLAAEAAAHFFRRCISLGCVDYDVKASFAWHVRTKGGTLDLEKGTFSTANFMENDKFQVGIVDGWEKKEFGVFAKTGFTMSQEMIPEFETKMMLLTLQLDLTKMEQAGITKEFVMDAMSAVELGGMRSAIERNGRLHVALGGSLGHFVNSDRGACKGAIHTAKTPETGLSLGRTADPVKVKVQQDLSDLIDTHSWLMKVVAEDVLDGSSCYCCPFYVRPHVGERFVKGEQFFIQYDLPGPVLQDMSFDGDLLERALGPQGYRRPHGEDNWLDSHVTEGVATHSRDISCNECLAKESDDFILRWNRWLMDAAPDREGSTMDNSAALCSARTKRAGRKDVMQAIHLLQRREVRLLPKLRPNNEFPCMPLQQMGLAVWTTPQDGYCLYRNLGMVTGQSVSQVLDTCVAFTAKVCDPDGKPHYAQIKAFLDFLEIDPDTVTDLHKLFETHRTHCCTPGEDSKHLSKRLEYPGADAFRIFSCLGKRWLVAFSVKQDPTKTGPAAGSVGSIYVNGAGHLYNAGGVRDVSKDEMKSMAFGKDFDHGVLFDGEHYDTLAPTSGIARPISQTEFDIEEMRVFREDMEQCMKIDDDDAVVGSSEPPSSSPIVETGDIAHLQGGSEAGGSHSLTSDMAFALKLQAECNREGAREKAAKEAAELADAELAGKLNAGVAGAPERRNTRSGGNTNGT